MPLLTRFAFFIVIISFLAPLPARADMAASFRSADKNSQIVVDHSIWDSLLKTYVKRDSRGLNRVNYRAFKRSGHKALKTYLRQLQKVNVKALNRGEQFAFWVNLYNAKTVQIILSHYPVSSIRKIRSGLFSPGPWKLKLLRVNGAALTLDDIEHKILRRLWHDPRVHYAVNCASVGCPNLAREAYTGANRQKMLNAGARAYINSPRGVKISGGRVTASKIYSWFKEDFGGNERGVLRHLRRYAKAKLAASLKAASGISSYQYDWSLNDQKR